MKRYVQFLSILSLLAVSAWAQQAVEIGDYTIHYNALSTSELTPQVAQTYGIQRSSSRAMLNVTVLKSDSDGLKGPVPAKVSANAKNLTGQWKHIEMREISEGDDAIYYIGEFRVNNRETFDFSIDILPTGSEELLEVKFRQQFFTQ